VCLFQIYASRGGEEFETEEMGGEDLEEVQGGRTAAQWRL
jgi:hypothetical protein